MKLVKEGYDEKNWDKDWHLGADMVLFDKKYFTAVNFCPMCPYPDMVEIDITSDPAGGSIFITEQKRGTTTLHGIIAINAEPTIRIEYPKLKSCKFADGTYTPPKTADEKATFFCKLAP